MVQLEVKKISNVKLQEWYIDLRKNIKYKEKFQKRDINKNIKLRSEARLKERVQNIYKWIKLVWISLLVILIIGNSFNFKFDIANSFDNQEYTEQDIEQIVNKIDNQKYWKSISDEEYEAQVKAKEEEIRIYNEEVERARIERNKEVQKQEINKISLLSNTEKPIVKEEVKKEEFDIDRLAYAVSMAETSWFTKWYGVTHLNWQWIKHWNTVKCPWVPKMAMCKFKTQEESNEAFVKIWWTWYKEFPTLQMAKRWTWDDKAELWLEDVKYYYYNDKI